jgi:hypothetical protein
MSNIKIKGGKVELDIQFIVENMSPEDKEVFFEDLVFDDKIIEMFTDLATSDYAFESSKWSTTYSTGKPIQRISDKIRSIFLSKTSDVYKKQIENYETELNRIAKEEHEIRSKYWSIENQIKCAFEPSTLILDGIKYRIERLK